MNHKSSLMVKDFNIINRFWSKVDIKNAWECWEWLGSKNKRGYGYFSIKRKPLYAHRYSWIIHNDIIPYKNFICHKCDNPSCVNPSHLFSGTPKDNVMDCVKKGRFVGGGAEKKLWTHCINGHEFSTVNTYIRANGTDRLCRECRRIRARNKYKEIRESLGFSVTPKGTPFSHCKSGHLFTYESTIVSKKTGYRKCKICKYLRDKTYKRL